MSFSTELDIGGFKINQKSRVFIIAEISANHGQDIDIALRSIEAAAKTGADAVKLQTYTPDTITLNCDNEFFRIKHGTIWDGRTLYDLYKEAHTPWSWHKRLIDKAKSLGMICFSSPFDHTAVDFLEELEVPAYKIASFEITDIPLISYVASQGKPVIISTGIANEADIKLALEACLAEGNQQVCLLKCTSSYPAPVEESNLRMIKDFNHRFGVITGLSDHTLGITVPVVSVALGAKIIEKHFILDKSMGGPDASFSLDFSEFSTMVRAVREAESSLGEISYTPTEKMKSGRKFSRSLFISKAIKKGEIFNEKNIRSVRPGDGLPPVYYKDIVGKSASQDLIAGQPLSGKDIDNWNPK